MLNLSQAINALANLNFATAIFAPGWTFEHFRAGLDQSDRAREASQAGRRIEQTMWEGAKLPDNLQCDCTKRIQQHKLYFQNHPIVRHAREYPAGSATYFETDFTRAFAIGRRSEERVCALLIITVPFNRHPTANSQIPDLAFHATQLLI